jgi:uncharacterized protein YlxW (UPF0749 family)
VSGLAARLRSIPSWQATLGVALLVVGFLVATQLRTEAPRVRYSSQERPPLVTTARELQAQQQALKDRILALRAEIQDVSEAAAGNDALVADLNEQLRQARNAAGLVELVGPGLVLRLDDSTEPVPPDAAPDDYLVSAEDVRDVVGELWLAGAQAVSVNGERIGITTALVDLGSSVLVNSAYLQPPYVVAAIGPIDLYDRVASSAGFARFLAARAESYGIVVGLGRATEVVVPAYSGTINLTEGRPLPAPTPGSAP